MRTLATGVGDLKKVLSNVKTKGVLGEYQLENILEEILTSAQYEKNINIIPGSNARVEFAIKMPGQNTDNQSVYLPIDAKFPTEDYHSLLNAYEEGNQDKINQSKIRILTPHNGLRHHVPAV
jgi:DNA recombination protein RmuC